MPDCGTNFRLADKPPRTVDESLLQPKNCHSDRRLALDTGIRSVRMKVINVKRRTEAVLILFAIVVVPVRPQSSTPSSMPANAPQVRPALPQQQLPAPQEQDTISRAKAKAEKARSVVQAQEEQKLVQETRLRGYWVDPATKLMWEGRDNGVPLTWHKA